LAERHRACSDGEHGIRNFVEKTLRGADRQGDDRRQSWQAETLLSWAMNMGNQLRCCKTKDMQARVAATNTLRFLARH
jgi:hypothetical protein